MGDEKTDGLDRDPFDEAVACLDELCEGTRGWSVERVPELTEKWRVWMPTHKLAFMPRDTFADAVIGAADRVKLLSRDNGGVRVSLQAPDGGRKGRRVVRRQWRAFDPVEGPLDEPGWVEL